VPNAYSVKGSSISSKLVFARERGGPSAEAALRQQFAADLPFLESAWYPYSLYIAVLRAVVRHVLGGETERLLEVGRHSADVALGRTYRAFVRDDFVAFLGNIAELHRLFYSHGASVVALAVEGNGATIRHVEKPEMEEEDLWVALGFYVRAGELHGLKVESAFTREGDEALFELTWKR
jgi:hypothetical protein